MGKSHQVGWVVLRGKRWYGYFRKRVLNPITNEEKAKPVCIPLELKAKMTKSKARDALRAEVTKQTSQNLAGSRVLKDSSTTFGWFVRNRYFPLREGDFLGYLIPLCATNSSYAQLNPSYTQPNFVCAIIIGMRNHYSMRNQKTILIAIIAHIAI
jgi:hypothetical protein